MADFADSAALALDIELLVPVVAGRLSPALPAGEQLIDANLYVVCDLVAGRAAKGLECAAVTARSTRASATRSETSSAAAVRVPLAPRCVCRRFLSRALSETRRDEWI